MVLRLLLFVTVILLSSGSPIALESKRNEFFQTIKDKKVVVIAEMYHDDGTSIKLRNELIKELITNHGFKAVFEELDYNLFEQINCAFSNNVDSLYLYQCGTSSFWGNRYYTQRERLYDFQKQTFNDSLKFLIHGVDVLSFTKNSHQLGQQLLELKESIPINRLKLHGYFDFVSKNIGFLVPNILLRMKLDWIHSYMASV